MSSSRVSRSAGTEVSSWCGCGDGPPCADRSILPHAAGVEPGRHSVRPTRMDTPVKAALGGGLISTLAIGGMVAAGVLAASAALVVSDPSASPARADGLTRFADCEALREWYVDHTVDEVGAYGWGRRMVPMMAREDGARAP